MSCVDSFALAVTSCAIADGLNRATGIISEVKNFRYQALTSQVQDYIEYAQEGGQQFNLWVREGARLSARLQAAYDSDLVNIIEFPWP